ncbi:MAG: proton-conducting transporter membrane subunit, partial [Desulfohalobiaceae bacterium]
MFGFGRYGRLFLFATALLWSASGLAFTIRPTSARSRFAFFFLLTMTGNFGLIVVQDAASFYSFFALMTYAAYGLVIHERTPEALKAGRVYLIMALAGEGAIIAALILAVSAGETNSLANAAAALGASPWKNLALGAAALGFGVKAGAFLLHFWLPLAHPVAPTPASAVLSGCMIKAGLLGWLHFFP